MFDGGKKNITQVVTSKEVTTSNAMFEETAAAGGADARAAARASSTNSMSKLVWSVSKSKKYGFDVEVGELQVEELQDGAGGSERVMARANTNGDVTGTDAMSPQTIARQEGFVLKEVQKDSQSIRPPPGLSPQAQQQNKDLIKQIKASARKEKRRARRNSNSQGGKDERAVDRISEPEEDAMTRALCDSPLAEEVQHQQQKQDIDAKISL